MILHQPQKWPLSQQLGEGMSVHEKAANLEERMESKKGEIWVTNNPKSCFNLARLSAIYCIHFFLYDTSSKKRETPFLKQMISSYVFTNCQFQPSQRWILKAGFCSSWMNRIRWMLSAARSAVTCYAQQIRGVRFNSKSVRLYHQKETA